MASFPFRSTALAFDKDAFAKLNQQPDRAERPQSVASALSTNSSRPTLYDESALRKVMGGSRISHGLAKDRRKASGRRRGQISRVQSGLQKLPDNHGIAPQKNIEIYAQSLAQQHRITSRNPENYQAMTQPFNEFGSAQPRSSLPPQQPGQSQQRSHAQQDYEMQVMLLEQQNKKRLLMARQEQDNMPGPPQQNAKSPLGMLPQLDKLQLGPHAPQERKERPALLEQRKQDNASGSHQQNIQSPPRTIGAFGSRQQQDILAGSQRTGSDDTQQLPKALERTNKFENKSRGICPSYTISEDDTVGNRERQKAKFIALQSSSGQQYAMPRIWGT